MTTELWPQGRSYKKWWWTRIRSVMWLLCIIWEFKNINFNSLKFSEWKILKVEQNWWQNCFIQILWLAVPIPINDNLLTRQHRDFFEWKAFWTFSLFQSRKTFQWVFFGQNSRKHETQKFDSGNKVKDK